MKDDFLIDGKPVRSESIFPELDPYIGDPGDETDHDPSATQPIEPSSCICYPHCRGQGCEPACPVC